MGSGGAPAAPVARLPARLPTRLHGGPMSADAFLQFVTQALYVLIFIVTLIEAVRRPVRARVDIALFFGAVALVIAEGWVVAAFDLTPPRFLTALNGALVMALPYLLLRLVNDFSVVPAPVLRAAEFGLVLAAAGLFAFQPIPTWLLLPLVVYFFGFNIYAALAFVRESRRSSGVTKRRMQAVAAGSAILGVTILLAGTLRPLRDAAPEVVNLLTVAVQRPLTVASGLAYFIGFAPPPILRRAWQEPELRAFLGRAASLPRLPTTDAIARELERGAATALGAPYAGLGLWDEQDGVLRFTTTGERFDVQTGRMIAGQAFARQRALFTANAPRDDPEHAEIYRAYAANAVLAAPITAGDKRLGVLAVYAPRAPIFATEDLALLQLLADQAAVILESRALIDEATRVRAREEATRLKDDFLSAAAHDLKTPLTTLVATAELLERRARRDPAAPADLRRIQRLVGEAIRLKNLVLELLDASRVEQGQIIGSREPVDLAALAREVCARQPSPIHQFVVAADDPVIGEWDRTRIAQLLENLVENAAKYSPDGGEVRVTVRREGADAHLAVTDRGIGIPAADLPRLFDRFHRGTNVDDRRFSGMGLGLYICRGIVEQHGGQIAAISTPGEGATFRVRLPLGAAAAHPAAISGTAAE